MNDKAKAWHKENKMPKNPSLEEKIKWHYLIQKTVVVDL